MTYLTEEERAARKQLAQQKYKNKEEVKIRKRFNDCNSRRRRLGLSVFTFNEWQEWYKNKHAPKGSLLHKYKQFIQGRKKRKLEIISFEKYCELIAERNRNKSANAEERRLRANQKARERYHSNEEVRKRKMEYSKKYRKEHPEVRSKCYYKKAYEKYKEKVANMSEAERELLKRKIYENRQRFLKNMSEEKRLEYKKKHAARSRDYWRNLSPEKRLEIKERKAEYYKNRYKNNLEKVYEHLVKQRERIGTKKNDSFEDYLKKKRDMDNKTNHYNEDLSFLNEKFPLSQKLLSIEEYNRRTFIMQKLQRVLKHLGLSTKILMNYKRGHYTMQQLKTFLEMYQNKEWKNNERK